MRLQKIPLQEGQAAEEDEEMEEEEEKQRANNQQEQSEKDSGKKIHICPPQCVWVIKGDLSSLLMWSLVFPVCSAPVSHAECQDEVKEDSEEKKTNDVSRQGNRGKPQPSPANIFLRRHFPTSHSAQVFSNHNQSLSAAVCWSQ